MRWPSPTRNAISVCGDAVMDLKTLTARLTSLLPRDALPGGRLTIVDRRPTPHATTFPVEIVTCLLGDGSERQLFCKHSAGKDSSAYEHRGGVAYEARVYQEILEPLRRSLGPSTCRYYGTHTEPSTGDTWLVLEHLEFVMRVNYISDPAAMLAAVRWLARFHDATMDAARKGSFPWLKRYDAAYYLGWPRRTALFARRLHRRFPWLAALCDRAEVCLGPLFDAPATIIHGEYYPHNVMYDRRQGAVLPVDWESAAIGPAEIDLASLTERWPAQTVRDCTKEYLRIRRPEGLTEIATPPSRMDAARTYLHFRWLGEDPRRAASPERRWRFEELRRSGERLGLL